MAKKTRKLTWKTGLAGVWSKYMPPARPSKSELMIFEDYIKKAPDPSRILILGATPELRDLVLKYKQVPISAELNPKNFQAFKGLMKYQGKERFIQGDWLKLKQRNDFDFVLGHASFNMLPFSDWDKLIRIIHRSLKSGGRLIQAINVRYSQDKFKNVLNIFRDYRKKRKKNPVYYEIMMDLVLAVCDAKRNYSDFELLGWKLSDLYKTKKITREEYHGIVDVQVGRALKLTLPLKSKVDSLFKKHFPGVLIRYGKDPFSHNAPIYVLKKE